MDIQRISSIARQAGALSAVIVGAISTPQVLNLLPSSVSTVLIAVGGVLFGIEHHQSATQLPPVQIQPQATPTTPPSTIDPSPTTTTSITPPIVTDPTTGEPMTTPLMVAPTQRKP